MATTHIVALSLLPMVSLWSTSLKMTTSMSRYSIAVISGANVPAGLTAIAMCSSAGLLFSFCYTLCAMEVQCRKCESTETEQRYDTYGYSTGYWCHDCYENRYPYKKNYKYDYLDAGEYLDDDY